MTYYNDLMNETNAIADGIVTFTNSSCPYDDCGSIMCEISKDDETWVWLHAFETEDEMLDAGAPMRFQVVVMKESIFIDELDLTTNNKAVAIAYAVQQAKDMQDEQDEKEYVEMCNND